MEHVFKGRVAAELTFLDFGTQLAASVAQARFPNRNFGIGGCSVFQSGDPTGRYIILGLAQVEDGTYLANRLIAFFVGEAPSGPAYEEALVRLASLGPVKLPRAGTGPAAAPPPPAVRIAFALTGLVTLGALALALRASLASRTRRNRCR